MKKIYNISVLISVVLVINIGYAYSQGASDGADTRETSIGSRGGVGINVTPTSGNVNYQYPISHHSVGRSPIDVSLNYSGSVFFTAFGERNLSVTYGSGFPDGYSWKSITKIHPAWIIGVNGFAIQVLNTNASFNIYDPTDLNGCYDPVSDEHFNWLIDGYDFCNRVTFMQNPNEQDVIRILRDDGSVMELRNPTTQTPGGGEAIQDCITGYYYENAVNSHGFGVVSFDSTTYWPSYVKNRAATAYPDRYQNIPRILRYYPGDGLEYVFREIVAPYGILSNRTFSNAGPTIFYLEEIKNGYQVVSSFKRSRHYPTEANIDTTYGRALTTEFHGHRITYSDTYASIEALGKTYIVRYGADFSSGDGTHPYTYLRNFGDSTSELQLYGYDPDGVRGYATYGYVHSITDPQNRVLQFGYDTLSKIYNMKVCDDCCDVVIEPLFRRMSEVKSATGKTTIEYYTGDYNVSRSKIQDSKSKVIPETQHVAKEVKQYDYADNLLSTVSYSFDNAPSGYNRKSTVISKDNILNLSDTVSFFSRFWSFPAYKTNPYQPYTCPNLSFSSIPKTVRSSSKGITTTYQFYPDSLSNGSFIMLPRETKQYIKPYNVIDSILVAKTIYSYELATAITFGGDTSTARAFGQGISKLTSKIVRPDSTADTMFTSVTQYRYIPYSTTLVTRIDTTWDEWKSLRITDSLRWIGEDTTAVIYKMDTLTNKLTALPPLRGLTTSSFLFYKGDTVNGVRMYYDTSYSPTSPPNRRRGYLIADTQYVNNGHIIPGSSKTYNSGWYRTLANQSSDIFGSTSRLLYRNSSIPTGTLYDCEYPSSFPVTKKLYEYHEEYETSIGAETYIRKYKPGGSLTTDTLRSYIEHTVGGLSSAMVDANNAYSAMEYDNAGRVTTAWTPMNFPPSWERSSNNVSIWDRETREYSRVDTFICATDELKSGSDTTMTNDYTHLKVYNHPADLLNCADTSSPNPNHAARSGEIILRYIPKSTDRFHQMILTKATLQLFVAVASIDYEPTVHFKMKFKDSVIEEDYLFTAPDPDTFEETATKLYPFEIELSLGMRNYLQGSHYSDTLTVEITSISGGDLELLCKAEDLAPHFKLEGTPANDQYADFAVSMKYDDSTQAVSLLSKIDDAEANSQTSWTRSTSTKKGRYTAVESQISEANATKGLMLLTIGNPYSPIRIDTVTTIVSGLGLPMIQKDIVGYESRVTYNSDSEIDTVFNTDGSFIRQKTAVGLPLSFGITDQNFHGFCTSLTTYNENGTKFTIYRDLYGRLRRKVSDTANLKITELYEYDDFGRLVKYTNPKGDTISFAFDDFGRIRFVVHPDFGKVSYGYDIKGRVRFSQTQTQHNTKRLSYYQYDDLGRITLSGEAQISGLPVAYRLTDVLDVNKLHLSSMPSGSIYTSNKYLFTNPDVGTVKEFSNSSSIPECLPGNHQRFFDDEEPDSIKAPYLRRSMSNWEPVTHTSDTSSFENTSTYPDFVRRGVWYDSLPPRDGAVWASFPAYKDWDSIAPKKSIRFGKGRPVALAYRGHGGEPWHYLVYSYNEQGQVEALLRYTENLGFDAVYYTYNHQGMLIRQCTADPFNQHCTWYGYDQNGRPDSVWSDLGLDKGLTIDTVRYPTPLLRPSTPDAIVFYGKRGNADSVIMFPPSGGNVRAEFFVGSRFTDSVVANQGGSTIFKQGLSYDGTGNLIRQKWQGGELFYGYDSIGRLKKWGIPGADTTVYVMDSVGNRLRTMKADTVFQQLDYSVNKLNSSLATNDTTYYSFDADGAITSIIGKIAGDTISETFNYNADGMLYKYVKRMPWKLKPCFPDTATPTTYSTNQEWRYRYSGSGEREQKRAYYSQESDSCSGILPWVYYLLGFGSEQLAVWHGRQSSEPDGCGESGRRVVWYPVEYRSSGGAAVYVRGADGGFVKELRMFDHLGSVRIRMKTTGNESLDYSPYGSTTTGATSARSTFINKEKDAESKNRISDFSARKYEEKTGRFMRPDPLWGVSPGVSSYVYGNASPMNYCDPSGLIFTKTTYDPSTGEIIIQMYTDSDPLTPQKKLMTIRVGGMGGSCTDSWTRGGVGIPNGETVPGTPSGVTSAGGGASAGFHNPANASGQVNSTNTPNSNGSAPPDFKWVDQLNAKLGFENPEPGLLKRFYEGVIPMGGNYYKDFLNSPDATAFVHFESTERITEIYNSGTHCDDFEDGENIQGLTKQFCPDENSYDLYFSIDFLFGDSKSRINDNCLWTLDDKSELAWTNWELIGHEFGHVFHRVLHPEEYFLKCLDPNRRSHEYDAQQRLFFMLERNCIPLNRHNVLNK